MPCMLYNPISILQQQQQQAVGAEHMTGPSRHGPGLMRFVFTLQQQQEAGQPRGPAVLTSGTLRLDVGPMAAAARAPLAANNQKLGLLTALLRVRSEMQMCCRSDVSSVQMKADESWPQGVMV